MSGISPFSEAQAYAGQAMSDIRGVRMAMYFGPPADEYDAARTAAALFDRSDRGLLVLTGRDRLAWLHNLVTNSVTTLEEGTGNYAFAVNVRGRILFDLNVLCLAGRLWLDLDGVALAIAAGHFDRHLFTEDVKIENVSGQFARLGCSGPRAAELAGQLGVTSFRTLPALAHVPLADEVRLVRHDFTGGPGFELIVPRGHAALWWDRLAASGARSAGFATLDLLRIEAGVPWLGRDFDDGALPPETGQIERGVSFRKGCYLGQEVLERMRAHGALARRLVRLRVADGEGLTLPAAIRRDGIEIGRITSLVPHPKQPYWPGLGYLQTAVTGYADITAGDPPRAVTICSV